LPPPASSSSEKNLRSGIASPPGSPLNPQQLKENYQTQSLPKSKSYGSHRDELLSVLLGKKRASKQDHSQVGGQSQSQTQTQSQSQSQSQQEAMFQAQRQHGGVAVFPDSLGLNRNSYFAEQRIQQRHLRSVGDSSQELESGSGSGTGSGPGGPDISDSQRSLSEGRLLDVDG